MNLLKVVFSILAGLAISTSASSDEIIYSHEFGQGVAYHPGSAQFDNWLNYRASLPDADITSITVSGSLDPIGRTCSDPVIAQQIADVMRIGASGESNGTATLSVWCDDNYWNTGACGAGFTSENNLELNVGAVVNMCVCDSVNYTIRPGIAEGTGNNANWGGVNSATCGGSTQTMTVTVNVIPAAEPDTDGDGVPDDNDVCRLTAPATEVDVHGCSDAQVDGDGDGICDPDAPSGGPSFCTGVDAFPDDPSESSDNDGDGTGDNADDDDDNDGQTDVDEIACNSDPLDGGSTAPDADNDGVPDCVDADDDNDLVADDIDVCQATAIPEAVPTSGRGLGRNRWTLDNPDGSFTQARPQAGRLFAISTADTGGCSCEQIIVAAGLDKRHRRRGCSTIALLNWVNNSLDDSDSDSDSDSDRKWRRHRNHDDDSDSDSDSDRKWRRHRNHDDDSDSDSDSDRKWHRHRSHDDDSDSD